MKCKMDISDSVNFDIDYTVASLLGFKKQNGSTGKYIANRIVDIMSFSKLLLTVILYLVLKALVKIVIYFILLI